MTLSLQLFQKVLGLDRHGYFPRPQESLEEFIRSGPNSFNDTSTLLTHPPELVSHFWMCFSLDVRSLPVEVSKKGILPWEPACCWVDKEGKSFIRIRPFDEHRIVSRNAVLAHEFVHALRSRLFSNHFEEMCAYTAASELFPKDFPKWRTWLSPLFSSAKEFMFTFCWMIGCWALPWIIDREFSPLLLLVLSLSPLILFTVRLTLRWNKWNTARKVLSSINEKGALPLLLRLADEDINWLSRQTLKGFPAALKERTSKEWRWSFFKEAFLTTLQTVIQEEILNPGPISSSEHLS
jgi:hypothetical protein